jgi:hypothetical protein
MIKYFAIIGSIFTMLAFTSLSTQSRAETSSTKTPQTQAPKLNLLEFESMVNNIIARTR